ncbi:hypothetical protein [Polluticaenibacter yanchengensis]|uniref:DUF4625 domain-containing protein n=1 Tax=Polluticaenibacter yanchengensis TaxID=3014562 RepID=A0ABT4UGR0_9BACT|nr:hypothetical protein [Chitinophagaceae bacterium LY-5]
MLKIKHSILAFCSLALGLVLLNSCSKDSYTTKPQLKLKSVNSYLLHQRDNLNVSLEVTDKEGDIQGEMFIARSVKGYPQYDQTFTPFPISADIPSSSNFKAEVNICFTINSVEGNCPYYAGPVTPVGSDTTTFSFWIKDKAGNISDTLVLEQPIIIER